MGTMNPKTSNIIIIPQSEMVIRKCWGCEKKVKVIFKDISTGGYLCRTCMPDTLWADTVLRSVKGLRDPKDGEFPDLENN